jgi:UTP--glucose-1-phosphate uridylyltransferase
LKHSDEGVEVKIHKAVIPAAGLGTRFLPYTKVVAKELLPIVDKPAIHYIFAEGVASHIDQFTVISSKGKDAIADYFDASHQLESYLHERGKNHLLHELDELRSKINVTYIRQAEPLGLGHAVLMARQTMGQDFFGVFLPDDLIASAKPAMAQLMDIALQQQASVLALAYVPADQVSRYGIVKVRKQVSASIFELETLVEKPSLAAAPSNLAIIGRYILSPHIFGALETIGSPTCCEIQLTDGIARLLHQGHKVFGCVIEGKRYDIGNPVGWLEAAVDYAKGHETYGHAVMNMMQQQRDFI